MRVSIFLILAIAGGCGDGRERALLTVPVDPSALLTLVQDGDGAWRPVVADADGIAQIEIGSDRFGQAHVCWQRHPATDEPAVGLKARLMTLDTMVMPPPCGLDPTVRIEGRVTEGARVYVGGRHITAPDGTYTIDVASPGVWDVAATVSADDRVRVLIERAVALDATRTLDLDVAGRGLYLMPVAVEISGGVSDSVLTYGAAVLASGTQVRFNLGGTRPRVLPPQLMMDGDRIVVGAVANDFGSGTFRTAQRAIAIDDVRATIAIAIPGPEVLDVDGRRARWTNSWDAVAVELWSVAGSPPTVVSIEATAGWLADGAAELTVPDLGGVTAWDPARGGFAPGDTLMWSVASWRGDPAGDLMHVRRSSTTIW